MHSTVKVDANKWFEYAGERAGRFQGLTNPDGSAKTECGIHSSGSGQAQGVRDLWPQEMSYVEELGPADALSLPGNRDAIFVVYAPWCQFCQARAARPACPSKEL